MIELIREILKGLPKEKEAFKVGQYLLDKHHELYEGEIQESLNDFLFLLYVMDKKQEALKFSEYFKNYIVTSDKQIWTFVESSLTLIARIYREMAKIDESLIFINKMKEAFNTGTNQLAIQINNKNRVKRLNGEDLVYDKINKSILDEKIETQFDLRMIQLKKLFFISEMGYGEVLSQNRVEAEIELNLDFLKEHLY